MSSTTIQCPRCKVHYQGELEKKYVKDFGVCVRCEQIENKEVYIPENELAYI